jgi:hypothetical protein
MKEGYLMFGPVHQHVCPECGESFPCGLARCQHDEFKICYPCEKTVDYHYKCDASWLFRDKNHIEPTIDKKLIVMISSQRLTVRELYDHYAAHHGLPSYDEFKIPKVV